MAIRCQFLQLTCKKLYYLGTVCCWLVTSFVILTRFHGAAIHRNFLVDEIPVVRVTSEETKSIKTNQTTFISMLSGNVHIYSAIARNKVIGLNGWESSSLRDVMHYCCLFYGQNDIQSVPMLDKLHWNFLGKAKLETKQFVCPNPRHTNNTLPLAVSMTRHSCPDDMSVYIKVQTPFPLTNRKEEIAVCTKLAFGNLSASEMIEWFEVQKSLGVSKIVTYTHKLNDAAMEVLKYYQAEGLGEHFPFELPDTARYRRSVGVKNFQSWNDEQVVVLDCHGRLANYPYIGLYDMDEFIIPKKLRTLLSLVKMLRRVAPRAAGFTLKTEIYASTWGRMDDDNPSDMMIGQYFNRTRPFRDRPKSIIITDRVEPGRLSTHGFWPVKGQWYTKPLVPENYATLKHYRSCRKEWLKKDNGYKCYTEITRVTDRSMLTWVEIIKDSVEEVKIKLFSKDNR